MKNFCKECYMSFTRPSTLQDHIDRCHPERAEAAPPAPKDVNEESKDTFESKLDGISEKLAAEIFTNFCDKCCMTFTQPSFLQDHIDRYHPERADTVPPARPNTPNDEPARPNDVNEESKDTFESELGGIAEKLAAQEKSEQETQRHASFKGLNWADFIFQKTYAEEMSVCMGMCSDAFFDISQRPTDNHMSPTEVAVQSLDFWDDAKHYFKMKWFVEKLDQRCEIYGIPKFERQDLIIAFRKANREWLEHLQSMVLWLEL